ncbi:hypothetical protein FLM48_03180 [Shewanella sp. Scap07]|nr:hypothetical protein FLM48_03180 [Shewanella sp. Scap07]
MKLFSRSMLATVSVLTASLAASSAIAHDRHQGGIHSAKGDSILAPFDIVHAKITTNGNVAVFHMAVAGNAGEAKPNSIGKLAGSDVFSYVWPTSIDSYEVGFEKSAGILALAVTSHPDFDDTPLFDENGDGNTDNDGDLWHSHWVVLQPNEQCGVGALSVVDIPDGASPRLPKTWPGLPLLIDSPGWQPTFDGDTVEVKVPFNDINIIEASSYDGVTSGLRVNQSVHSPLLCVVDVMDIASGDLSLPGKVNR